MVILGSLYSTCTVNAITRAQIKMVLLLFGYCHCFNSIIISCSDLAGGLPDCETSNKVLTSDFSYCPVTSFVTLYKVVLTFKSAE